MSEITEKVLRSGLIDEHVAQLMEKFGMLPEGSAMLAKGMQASNLTRSQMVKLAEELATVVEREHMIRETALDLDRLRWPAWVHIMSARGEPISPAGVSGLLDRMGRFYFRPQDVKKEWFVPGYLLRRGTNGALERIVEVSDLFIGEQVAALQVSTVPA